MTFENASEAWMMVFVSNKSACPCQRRPSVCEDGEDVHIVASFDDRPEAVMQPEPLLASVQPLKYAWPRWPKM